MKTFKDILNESFDKPYGPIQWKGQQGFGKSITIKGEFKTDEGTPYQIEFVVFPGDDGGNAANVEFKQLGNVKGNPTGITGAGDQFRVFATVIDGIEDIVKKKQNLPQFNLIRLKIYQQEYGYMTD